MILRAADSGAEAATSTFASTLVAAGPSILAVVVVIAWVLPAASAAAAAAAPGASSLELNNERHRLIAINLGEEPEIPALPEGPVQLSCGGFGGRPFDAVGYRWRIAGAAVPEATGTSATLTVDGATVEEAGGSPLRIECWATRSDGVVAYAVATLLSGGGVASEAREPVVSVSLIAEESLERPLPEHPEAEDDLVAELEEGRSASVRCTLVHGQVAAYTMKLLKNGEPATGARSVSDTELVLDLPHLSASVDSGTYGCLAEPSAAGGEAGGVPSATGLPEYRDLLLRVVSSTELPRPDFRKANPVITSRPSPKIEQEATSTVVLECRAENASAISWRINGTDLILEDPACNVSPSTDFAVGDVRCEVAVAGDQKALSRLIIPSLEVSGTYECVASGGEDGETATATTELVCLSQPPEVVLGPQGDKVIRLYGANLEVACSASKGIPSPSLQWIRESDGKILVASSGAVTLRIEGIGEGDAGTYSCQGSNRYGKDEQKFTLIGVRPTLPAERGRLTDRESLVTANAGSSVVLDCSVNVDGSIMSEKPKRSWYKNSNLLPLHEDKATLQIPYLTLSDHEGFYECFVETIVDKLTLSWNLKVNYMAPELKREAGFKERHQQVIKVMTGQNVTLPCSAETGIPTPQVSLRKGGQNLLQASSESTLTRHELTEVLQVTHEGQYVCMAVNEYGSDQIIYKVEVLQPTSFDARPRDAVVDTFGAADFDCRPKPDPRIGAENVVVTWWWKQASADGGDPALLPKNSGNPQRLELTNVTKADQGTYTCSIDTGFDSVNSTANLKVVGEAPSFLSTEKDVRVLEGSDIVIACQANGLPLPTIKWTRDTVGGRYAIVDDSKFSVGPLGDLAVSGVTLGDQGVYRCAASNIYGMVETSSNVVIIERLLQKATSSGKEIVANLRGSVRLDCDFPLDPRIRDEVRTEWLRKMDNTFVPVVITASDQQKRHRQSSALRQKFLVEDSPPFYLRISDLTLADSGLYRCVVKTPFEEVGQDFSLTINGEAPKIVTNLPPSMTVLQGKTVNLTCSAKGVPRPDVVWYLNEQPLNVRYVKTRTFDTNGDSMMEASVVIDEAEPAVHAGTFKCEAGNLYGSGVAKFSKVNVVRKTYVQIVDAPAIERNAANSEAVMIGGNAGEKLKIPCAFKLDPLNRVMNIQWEKDGKPLKVDATDRIDFGMDGSLNIADAQKKHAGRYACIVTTQYDRVRATAGIDIAVNAPVITSHSKDMLVFSGESVALICNVKGIPRPEVRWSFNSTPTSTTGKEFRIMNAISTDTGTYTCLAKNQYGETKQSVKVAVLQLPDLKKEYFVAPGSDLVLPCVDTRHSNASLSVVWKKEQRVLEDSTHVDPSGSLRLESFDPSTMAGIYSCTILSSDDQRRRILETWVRAKTKLIISAGGERFIDGGEDSVTLACNVLPGVHDAKRLWKYNNSFLLNSGFHDSDDDDNFGRRKRVQENGEFLEISKLQASDSGIYTCLASSLDSKDSIEFDLKVVPSPLTSGSSTSVGQNNHVNSGAQCKGEISQRSTLKVSNIENVDNVTAVVSWALPNDDDFESCYESINIVWWTNDSEKFFELLLPLGSTTVNLGDLSPDTGYYVQINLVSRNQGRVLFGQTRSFVLAQVPDASATTTALSENEDDGLAHPLLVSLISVALVCVVFVALAVYLVRRRKKSRGRSTKQVSQECQQMDNLRCCCMPTPVESENIDEHFGKTNFNGFDRNAYQAAIMPLDGEGFRPPVSGGGPGLSRVVSMAMAEPQWPEPEEPSLPPPSSSPSIAAMAYEEREPFIPRYTTFLPSPSRSQSPSHHQQQPLLGRNRDSPPDPMLVETHKRRTSKTSISSSWSSLFNVPATSTSDVTAVPAKNAARTSANKGEHPSSTFGPGKQLKC